MKLVPYKSDVRFLKTDESFTAYDIVTEKQTPIAMQRFAKSRWAFPMMLYFESYPFEKEEILKGPLPVEEIQSKKKIIQSSMKGFHRELLPAFALRIENETMLELAFEELFYVAEQNLLFALTNEPCFVYKGYVVINSDTAEILLADYDG